MAKSKKSKHARLGIIGFGAMGSAIAFGLLNAGKFGAKDIIVFDKLGIKTTKTKKQAQKEKRKSQTGIQSKNFKLSATKSIQDLASAKMILIAVKPKDINELLSELKKVRLSKETLIISIAAGIKISQIEKYLPNNPIVRVMPNTPAQIAKGISAIAVSDRVSAKAQKQVSDIFKTLGEVLVLPESKFDAVTALSGSGPAYVFLFIEAMTEAGVAVGLSRAVAEELAVSTVYGAGILAKESNEPPKILREKVTSKGGTTEAALACFKKNAFNKIVIQAIEAACKRSRELSA